MGFGQDAEGWDELTVGKTMKYVVLAPAAVERWPQVKPHWRRFRRRLCHFCHNHAHLSEPRYLVCSGCGVARYCSEACQAADWFKHQHFCARIRTEKLHAGFGELEAMGLCKRTSFPASPWEAAFGKLSK